VHYPLCVDIEAQTRGVHDATCIGDATDSKQPTYAAIYVNASNNTVEDVHFENFWDGIQIDDTTTTIGNIFVANVTGGDSGAQPQNVVHICGSKPAPSGGGGAGCSTHGTVTDVIVFQSTYQNPLTGTSVQDDVTGTSIRSPQYGCQGRSKSRPQRRSKSRPGEYVEDRGLSGRRASGAEACAA